MATPLAGAMDFEWREEVVTFATERITTYGGPSAKPMSYRLYKRQSRWSILST